MQPFYSEFLLLVLALMVLVLVSSGCAPLTYEQQQSIVETSEDNKQALKDISDDFGMINDTLASPFTRYGFRMWPQP
jgi:protein involved in sex pheromone biosynthesis